MGYEDVLYDAEWMGEAIAELISNLNTTEFYNEEEILAYFIKGLLKQLSDESRVIVLNLVDELLEEG